MTRNIESKTTETEDEKWERRSEEQRAHYEAAVAAKSTPAFAQRLYMKAMERLDDNFADGRGIM